MTKPLSKFRLRRLLLGTFALCAAGIAAGPSLAAGPLEGGKTIKLLFVGDPFAQVMQKQIAEFEKMAGGKIELEVVGYPETRNKTLLNSQNSESAYDIVSIDGVWMGEYAADEILLDVTDMVPGSKIDLKEFVPSIWEMGQVAGRQISVPVQPHPEMLEYRKDLFDRDGIPEPKTWDDVLAAAKHFHGKDGMSGICWNGARGSALGQTFFHFIWAAGVKPLDKDGRPQLDDPKAMDAANYLLELMKYSPPGILNMAWDERARAYAKGECAIIYEWAGRGWIWELDESSPARGTTAYIGRRLVPRHSGEHRRGQETAGLGVHPVDGFTGDAEILVEKRQRHDAELQRDARSGTHQDVSGLSDRRQAGPGRQAPADPSADP